MKYTTIIDRRKQNQEGQGISFTGSYFRKLQNQMGYVKAKAAMKHRFNIEVYTERTDNVIHIR